MKKRFFSFALLITLFASFFSFIAIADTDEDVLKAKHEDFIIGCYKLLVSRACDQTSGYSLSGSFLKDSPAWNTVIKLDAGFFHSFKNPSYKNIRTGDYVALSDTEFKCNLYGDYSIVYVRNGETVTFECAYTFYARLVKNKWMIYDFENIPRASSAAFAEQLSSIDPGITVHAITGHSFYGYLMVVDDPSRVIVGTIEKFSNTDKGLTIYDICARYGAIAAINGGGFADNTAGTQSGNPNGLVITEGKQRRNFSPYNIAVSTVIGFDYNDKLIAQKMTTTQFSKVSLRDALVFSPVLVEDGKVADTVSERKTFSARTAIGQAADGSVLMLVVDGRQPDSYGANMEDLANVLISYGCVTAGNLDGGASSAMCIGDYKVTSNYIYDYSRDMPTAFIVK